MHRRNEVLDDSFNFLLPIEVKARNHGIILAVGFLVLLPIGVLIARYTRTFTPHWFWSHAFIQLVISGPVIFYGWAQGYQVARQLELQNLNDPHHKIGIALLTLYVTQLLLGAFVHFVKLPRLFRGHRPPWSYLHVALGLAILALAAYQVHYGFTIEGVFALEGLHAVTSRAMHAWLALVIVFWVLYFLGMGLLPRQYMQEAAARQRMPTDMSYGEDDTREKRPLADSLIPYRASVFTVTAGGQTVLALDQPVGRGVVEAQEAILSKLTRGQLPQGGDRTDADQPDAG
ncbi:hypothetical protein GGX14DRAFT_529703 [Mycena pura]|uniref:Cytochrome b561 domain-containing protein n=1 Tax=Mycena pura TaxID=153505 RepID=A0AAD6UKT4_9AGAR|nr:hypothetical protein GGX14DRAFT_529703 [Mycena pura]